MRNTECEKCFQTIQRLSRHVPTCLTKHEIANIVEYANDSTHENEISNGNSYIFDESVHSSTSLGTPENHLNNCSFICDESAKRVRDDSYLFNSSDTVAITCDEITKKILMGLLTLNMNEKTVIDVFRLTQTLLK